MIAYPDTSFLCALYVAQTHSNQALKWMKSQKKPLVCTTLLLYEFRQSLLFQAYRHTQNPRVGYPLLVARVALAKLASNLSDGVYDKKPVDWASVHETAERLSAQHTWKKGHRSFDILHVASAIHLGAEQFLTFDINQKTLAEAEGLIVPESLG